MSAPVSPHYDKAVARTKAVYAADIRLGRPTAAATKSLLEAVKVERAVAHALANAPTELPGDVVDRVIGMLRAGA